MSLSLESLVKTFILENGSTDGGFFIFCNVTRRAPVVAVYEDEVTVVIVIVST